MQLGSTPTAIAHIHGDAAHRSLNGIVRFYQMRQGVIVEAEIYGLPTDLNPCAPNIFAMHIHEYGSCTGNAGDPFADTGSHFNPQGCPHPAHAGDLPPLFGMRGYAWGAVYTERFRVSQVLGRSVIVHAKPDDFTTQPSGNAGAKIGCGLIQSAAAGMV